MYTNNFHTFYIKFDLMPNIHQWYQYLSMIMTIHKNETKNKIVHNGIMPVLVCGQYLQLITSFHTWSGIKILSIQTLYKAIETFQYKKFQCTKHYTKKKAYEWCMTKLPYKIVYPIFCCLWFESCTFWHYVTKKL